MVPRSFPRHLVLVATLLLVALNLLLFLVNRHTDDSSRAEASATRFVHDELPALMSYRSEDLDGYRDRVLTHATGSFRSQMTELLDPAFVTDARARQVTLRTTVQAVGTVSRAPDRVELLVYVNQWRTTRATKSPVLEPVRLQVVVARSDDAWRISRLSPR